MIRIDRITRARIADAVAAVESFTAGLHTNDRDFGRFVDNALDLSGVIRASVESCRPTGKEFTGNEALDLLESLSRLVYVTSEYADLYTRRYVRNADKMQLAFYSNLSDVVHACMTARTHVRACLDI